MINKKELLIQLQEALKKEEDIIPLYSRHIQNTLFLSGLNKETQAKVQGILDTLLVESTQHKNSFRELMEKITTEERDVY